MKLTVFLDWILKNKVNVVVMIIYFFVDYYDSRVIRTIIIELLVNMIIEVEPFVDFIIKHPVVFLGMDVY